jgi:DinB superfamily
LVCHMTYWETEVCARLENLSAGLKEKLNFPAMPAATSENWNSALAEFRRSNAKFRASLSRLVDSRLDEPLSSESRTVYVEAHGVIQHNLYHAGQIALLRRFLQ